MYIYLSINIYINILHMYCITCRKAMTGEAARGGAMVAGPRAQG